MKMKLTLVVVVCATQLLSARTLTSADGKKTIEAEVIDYNPDSGKVVIRNEGSNRNNSVDAKAFSKEDQEYFKEFLIEAAKRKALVITAEDRSVKQEAAKGGIYIYDRRNETFAIKIANCSASDVKDLEAKYDIYVSRYDKEGRKTVDVVSGRETIASIAGKQAHEFVSSPVQVTVGCTTTSSCPKCETHAASVKTERTIGVHLRLYDSEGSFLNEYYSSSAMKSAVLKQAREAQKNQTGT